MRGKGLSSILIILLLRITPAYAGKSTLRCCSRLPSGDHPRVCGEKPDSSGLPPFLQGSPPRMRGKAKQNSVEQLQSGITPAYAGKRPPAHFSV